MISLDCFDSIYACSSRRCQLSYALDFPPKYIVVLKFGLAVLIEYDVCGSASPKYADLLICHVFNILSFVSEMIL